MYTEPNLLIHVDNNGDIEVTEQQVRAARRLSPIGKIPVLYRLGLSSVCFDSQGQRIRGLFACNSILSGTLIGEYRGLIITEDEAERKRSNRNYFFGLEGLDCLIDSGNQKLSSFLRYINAPNDPSEANTDFFQVNDRILCMAKVDIEAGSELLAWYGPNTKQLIKIDVVTSP